jgi:hypothetical protein
VIGVNVESSKKRTLRLKLVLENNEVISVELPLPTATRLTDQLIDMEFKERFPDHGNEAHSDAPESTGSHGLIPIPLHP